MKKILLVLWASVLTLQESNAQSAEVLWDKEIGSLVEDFNKLSNGGFALATFKEENFLDNKVYSHSKLILTDSLGKNLKETYLGKDIYGGNRYVYKIIAKQDGYTIFGLDRNHYSDIEENDRSGVWMMDADCNGTEISSKVVRPINWENNSCGLDKCLIEINFLQPVEDGYIINVIDYSDYYNIGDNSVLFKIDKLGQLKWKNELKFIEALSMRETIDNEYIFIAKFCDHNRSCKNYLLKLNKEGDILIKKEILDLNEISYITNKNKKFLFSYFNENNKLQIVELNDEGEIIFKSHYDEISKQCCKLIETEDNNFFVLLSNELIKINKKGNILWQQDINIKCGNYQISNLGNNEYLIFGGYSGLNKNNGFVIKIKDNQTYLGIEDQDKKNESIYLYPNPVETYLYIKTPDNQIVKKIIITDITGKILIERREMQDKINMSMYAPGIYVIKIETENSHYIQKVLKR